MTPTTKLSQLLALMREERWEEALAFAAKFPELGPQKAAIKRGHEVSHNPGFYRQLGKDPDDLKEQGIAALKERYGPYLESAAE